MSRQYLLTLLVPTVSSRVIFTNQLLSQLTRQPVDDRYFCCLSLWWNVDTEIHLATKFHTTDIVTQRHCYMLLKVFIIGHWHHYQPSCWVNNWHALMSAFIYRNDWCTINGAKQTWDRLMMRPFPCLVQL